MARPRLVTDQEILKHAKAVFLEHGPSAPTTLIAERVGISQAALFKRFKTKRGLLLAALIPPDRPSFYDLLDAGPTSQPMKEQLLEIGIGIATFLQDMVPCIATLHASGFEKGDLFSMYETPPPILLQRSLVQWFKQAEQELPAVPPEDLATAFLGSLHIRAFFQHLGVPNLQDAPRSYVENVVTIFLQQVKK